MKAGEMPSQIVISKKCGNKNAKVYVDETLVLQIQDLNINFRQSICDIAANTGVSIGTIQGLVKKGLLKKQCCNLKPLLTDDHKLLRVAWIRNLIDDDRTYCNMMQYVHIDKKWFMLVTDGGRFCLSTAKEHQYKNLQQKKHITKVMFYLQSPNLVSSL